LKSIETKLATEPQTGRFCHGDTVTLADFCLAPQVNAGRMFSCELSPYPNAVRIVEECLKLDAFARAHPMKQPDVPKQS
jgi:glutathione S-transferase